jgi:hypothetical protein
VEKKQRFQRHGVPATLSDLCGYLGSRPVPTGNWFQPPHIMRNSLRHRGVSVANELPIERQRYIFRFYNDPSQGRAAPIIMTAGFIGLF